MCISLDLNIQNLIDNEKCYQTVRNLRWPNETISCTQCGSQHIIKYGYHNKDKDRQRYSCKNCNHFFDDLTNTIFEGHHQPLKSWILCLYFMSLNLSNRQISKELEINESDIQKMTTQLREDVTKKKPDIILSNEVESDETYIIAGHKGNSEAVKKRS